MVNNGTISSSKLLKLQRFLLFNPFFFLFLFCLLLVCVFVYLSDGAFYCNTKNMLYFGCPFSTNFIIILWNPIEHIQLQRMATFHSENCPLCFPKINIIKYFLICARLFVVCNLNLIHNHLHSLQFVCDSFHVIIFAFLFIHSQFIFPFV